jgi:hypothetical protein
MNTEKRYPNGFLTADYVFEQYEQLDPVEKVKVREMIQKERDEEFYQSCHTVKVIFP